MAGFRLSGAGPLVEVTATNYLYTRLPDASVADNVGSMAFYGVNDLGTITGTPYLRSPEVDDGYRIRVCCEMFLDDVTFNSSVQNTGKHRYYNTTMTASWGVGAFTTNALNSVTIGDGLAFGTYAEFPMVGAAALTCETIGAFTAQPQAGSVIEFGLFAFDLVTYLGAILDGAFFRLTSAGLYGVINYNGVETSILLAYSYVTNSKHQYLISVNALEAAFWIDGVKYGDIPAPDVNGTPFAASAQPFSIRHYINAPGDASPISFVVAGYTVYTSGHAIDRDFGVNGNAVYGAYQGLSGGTMGSLATYPNSTNPTIGIPTNTTAVLGTGLGGQVAEEDSINLAVNADGIMLSYQVPPGTITQPGRRLRVMGVSISGFRSHLGNSGGPYVAQFSLAFGHTSVSLATTETAASKAPRRIALGVHAVSAASVLTLGFVYTTITRRFTNPIYVNPGEFIAVVKKKIGTAAVGPPPGITYTITYDYSWE